MKKYFFIALIVAASSVFAEEETTVDGSIESEISDRKSYGSSVAPVVGYEPTYKFVAGGAYFYEQERFSFGIDANTNFGRVYQAHTTIHHDFAESFYYHLHSSLTKGFQPYYGEGGDTKVANLSRLWGLHGHSKLELGFRFSPLFSVGLFGDIRYRTEDGKGEGSPPVRQHPDETTTGVGFFTLLDGRDNRQSPRDGFMFRTDVTHVPRGFSSLAALEPFTQVEADFIVYKEILNQVVRDVIAAFHLSGGYTIGTPTFAYKFRLGGADRLRGYHENRFRGKSYYLQQTELRFPIWRFLGGAAFLGFGDATDADSAVANMSYGIGVRIGLPPNWVSKIRLDFGVGKDQQGVFADFGHTF